MTLPKLGRARRLAKQRIRDVLLTKLSAEIATALADDDWTLPPAMPDVSRVFLCPPEMPDAAPRNSYVFAYVYEDGPRVTERQNSEGPESAKAETYQDIRIVIAFTLQTKRCADENGDEPPPDEEMRHRADLYCEAVIEAMSKHAACCDSVVASVALVEDLDATVYLQDGSIIGACSVLYRVTQLVAVANRVCS